MTRRSIFRPAWVVSVVLIVVNVAWLRVEFGGPTATMWFSDLLGIPLALWATLTTWAVARRESGRARRAWFLLGAATLSWGAGEVVWSWYELALGREVPFPSLADVGFLGLIPLAVLGLLAFPAAPDRLGSQARTVLDGMVAAGSVLFISWATVLGPAFRGSEGSPFVQAIGLAYPLGDLVLLTMVLIVAARAQGNRATFALIGSGLGAIALADSAFLYLTQTDMYSSGVITDAGWNLGFLLIALGALRSAPTGAAHQERVGRWQSMLPYAPFVLAMLTACVVQVVTGTLEPFLFWTVVATVVLLAARTALMHLENIALSRNLEAKVEARTAELTAALRDLEEARRLEDVFLNTVSHELRTPVTAMLGTTEVLLHPRVELPDAARKLTEGARRSAQRMARLVEDLLISSSMSDGFECARTPFDIAEVARRAIDDPSLAARVHAEIPAACMAIGDADRTGVLLGHLIDNARKFAPDGQITVIVQSWDQVEVVVRDEGPGIPPSFHEKIFDRFFQIDGSDTREAQGSGLGLYIARTLAEAMGGSLRVGEGTGGAIFTLTLPASIATPTALDRPTPGAAERTA